MDLLSSDEEILYDELQRNEFFPLSSGHLINQVEDKLTPYGSNEGSPNTISLSSEHNEFTFCDYSDKFKTQTRKPKTIHNSSSIPNNISEPLVLPNESELNAMHLDEFSARYWSQRLFFNANDRAILRQVRRRLLNRNASAASRSRQRKTMESLNKENKELHQTVTRLRNEISVLESDLQTLQLRHRIVSSHAHGLYLDAHSKGITFARSLEETHSVLELDSVSHSEPKVIERNNKDQIHSHFVANNQTQKEFDEQSEHDLMYENSELSTPSNIFACFPAFSLMIIGLVCCFAVFSVISVFSNREILFANTNQSGPINDEYDDSGPVCAISEPESIKKAFDDLRVHLDRSKQVCLASEIFAKQKRK